MTNVARTEDPRIAIIAMALLLLAGCAQGGPTITAGQPCESPFVVTAVTLPVPKYETPLERWRRTKADYEAVSKAEESLQDKIREQTYPTLERYMAAEKELRTIDCGKLCVPAKSQ